MKVTPLKNGEFVPTALQVGIVQKFMSDREFTDFMKSYNENKSHASDGSREEVLNHDINKEDFELTKSYFNDLDVPLEKIIEGTGLSYSKAMHRINRVCRQLIFQHLDEVARFLDLS